MRSSHPFTAVGDRTLVARLGAPRTAETTRLAVVGDPHVATRTHGTNRVFHRTTPCLSACVDDLNDRTVDLVVFPGDLTKDGEPWNYAQVETILGTLEHPFVAVPGNHDLEKRGQEHTYPTAATFGEQFAGGPFPRAHRVGGLELLLLNTAGDSNGAYDDSHRGRVCTAQREWLETRLDSVCGSPESPTPVIVCHHNPIPLVGDPLRRTTRWRTFTLRERDRFQQLLERFPVELVLSGHHHLPALATEGSVSQLIAPALASYPQAYCLVEVGPDGTSIWLISVADETDRHESYELAANGPAFYRTLLGMTETTLDSLPLVTETSPLANDLVVD